jgi:hypothetical protein
MTLKATSSATPSGRIGKPTGCSQAEPVVSALRASPPCAFTALAERCETTRDGDMIELLEEAFDLCFPKPPRDKIWAGKPGASEWRPEYADFIDRQNRFSELMEAGAFLDAARELLVPHTLWAVGSMEEGPFARLCWPMPDGSYLGGYVEGHARGAALSMCAAALRGHALLAKALGHD